MNKPLPRLTPARPSAREDNSAAYMPRIPWRIVLFGALSIATVMGGYYYKERRKADQLRAQIIRVHDSELAEARTAYTSLRDKLEGLIVSAATMPETGFVDPRLNLAGLRAGNGLYLRLPYSSATSKKAIAKAAKTMDADHIASCLGLGPTSARGLYEQGEFLLPSYLDDVKKETDVMRLRVQDEMLSRRIRTDLPSVLGLTRSNWFMLVLQEGKNRRDAPVRVFLWDLQHSQLLLRARVKSQGVLLTTHILSKGTHPNAAPPAGERQSGAANDCSIASQLKQLTRTAHETAEEQSATTR